ncbi:MAG: hypothetical protein ACI4HQ_05925 [Acetatifactor sp.]
MENKEKETFSYTYSAKEQKEIQNIRRRYVAPEEDKMEYLRRLDAGVTRKATVSALISGTIGILVLGFGMSLVMSDLSGILGFHQNMALLIGIIIGMIGIVLAGGAYPLYNHVIKKERAKIAPEILRITEELMK